MFNRAPAVLKHPHTTMSWLKSEAIYEWKKDRQQGIVVRESVQCVYKMQNVTPKFEFKISSN